MFLSVSFSVFSQNANRTGKDYAFFFYIDNYRSRAWSDLPDTKKECEKIATELKKTYGFYTELIANPTKKEIRDKFLRIKGKRFGPKDQLLILFSGHGEYKNKTENGYFIPSDGKSASDDPFFESWLSYDELGTYLSMNNCNHTIVALDACFSGSFGDRWRGEGPQALPWEVEDDCQVKERKGLDFPSAFYFSSGNKSQKTPAKSKFASKFLEFLREPDEDVLNVKNLRYYLSLVDSPEPEFGTFSTKHEAGGNFVFIKKNACIESEVETDDMHWAKVVRNKKEKGYYEHGFRFSDCKHKEEIKIFLDRGKTKDKLTKKSPSTKRSYSKHRDSGVQFVKVASGMFRMGCTPEQGKDCLVREKPAHDVQIASFKISKYEVTNEQYCNFLNQSTRFEKRWLKLTDENCQIELVEKSYRPKTGFKKHPVILVSWEGAQAFAEFYGMRLPTESEWEYASRGGHRSRGFKYSGSNKAVEVAWIDESAKGVTHQVGTKKPNELGIYDMSGNVWEWCQDCWNHNYKTAPKNGTAWNSGNCARRILRGGSCIYSIEEARVSNRGRYLTDYRHENIGFRVVRDQ